ncbi:hypothetical protein FQN54_009911 [Arachnomyces sp. PD_36]|nr:hypothetical protein FQN54_009911 [Arachnomyces sp. PD_36]
MGRKHEISKHHARRETVNRAAELQAWLEGQAAVKKAASSLPENLAADGNPSSSRPEGSERQEDDITGGTDTGEEETVLTEEVNSQDETEVEGRESEEYSLIEMEEKKDIDPRWRSYHGDPAAREPIVSREEFDRYRVLAEKQMKQLREDRDQLRKMLNEKCDELREEVERREKKETSQASEHEAREISELGSNDELLQMVEHGRGKGKATPSDDEYNDKVYTGPFESVRQVNGMVFQVREMKIRMIIQEATMLAKCKAWRKAKARAIEALNLVGMLRDPSIDARCWFWYAISCYHQKEFVKAADGFAKSRSCRAEGGYVWYAFSREADFEIDADGWLRHCKAVLAYINTHCVSVTEGGKTKYIPIHPDSEDPNAKWYSLPRSSAGVGNWVQSVAENTLGEGSGRGEKGQVTREDAQDERGRSTRAKGKKAIRTLEDELEKCAINDDSESSDDPEGLESETEEWESAAEEWESEEEEWEVSGDDQEEERQGVAHGSGVDSQSTGSEDSECDEGSGELVQREELQSSI